MDNLAGVDPGVVQNQESWLAYLKGQHVKFPADEAGVYVFARRPETALVAPAYHPKAVDFRTLFRGDEDILAREMPAVGHIAFRANMAFVPKVKVYQASFRQLFEFRQAF